MIIFSLAGLPPQRGHREGLEGFLQPHQKQNFPPHICTHSGGQPRFYHEGQSQRGVPHFCLSTDPDGVRYRVSFGFLGQTFKTWANFETLELTLGYEQLLDFAASVLVPII